MVDIPDKRKESTMQTSTLILKGNIVFSPSPAAFEIHGNSFLVAENGLVKGIFENLPPEYDSVPISDYGDDLIIPGFVDLHSHASQFANRGIGHDKELLPWLETYAFPEESKFSDMKYAEKIYKRVVQELWRQGTTRSVLFGTIHKEATVLLMDLLASSGLSSFVGKVNMDRNCPIGLRETAGESLQSTEAWLNETKDKYKLVKPIITPRFVPSCSPELMDGLGKLAREYDVPVQSHLSENLSEIAWAKKLHPEFPDYASIYRHFGLFGQQPTIMAHCIYNTDNEIELMAKNSVLAAHSPCSNNNLASGISPVRKLLDKGAAVGLATDVAGGHDTSVAKAMALAVQVSKLKWLSSDQESGMAPLCLQEVFYMGTKGAGSFFGKVGSFETGYELDAIVIDDSSIADPNGRTVEERLERFIYIGSEANIVERFVAGRKVGRPEF